MFYWHQAAKLLNLLIKLITHKLSMKKHSSENEKIETLCKQTICDRKLLLNVLFLQTSANVGGICMVSLPATGWQLKILYCTAVASWLLFLSFVPTTLWGHWMELKCCHVLGSKSDLQVHVQNLRGASPKIADQNLPYWWCFFQKFAT